MLLKELKVEEYVNQVDALTSTPGGGSVAALSGALGVALAKMMAHFSVMKKKFTTATKAKQNKFILAFKELDHYKSILINGIDADAISYQAVMDAYKSKDEDEIEKALTSSAFVAFEIQDASYQALKYLDKLIELGNKNLYSDLISGAILLNSCCEMTSYNVVANATLLRNEKVKEYYLENAATTNKKCLSLKNKIIKKINKI